MDVKVGAPAAVGQHASEAVPPLHCYMTLPVEHYTLLPLPLGATLQRVETEKDLFALSIPRVRFFNLTVKPTITVSVRVVSDDEADSAVVITVVRSRVDGDWADRLRLNQLFEIWGTTHFTWRTGSRIDSVTDLRVGIDPPPPFSRIPSGVLVRVGNAVLNAVCFQLQRVFLAALAVDYKRWAIDTDYRARRAEGELECAITHEEALSAAALHADTHEG